MGALESRPRKGQEESSASTCFVLCVGWFDVCGFGRGVCELSSNHCLCVSGLNARGFFTWDCGMPVTVATTTRRAADSSVIHIV